MMLDEQSIGLRIVWIGGGDGGRVGSCWCEVAGFFAAGGSAISISAVAA